MALQLLRQSHRLASHSRAAAASIHTTLPTLAESFSSPSPYSPPPPPATPGSDLGLSKTAEFVISKQLKKASASLTQELTECKSILAETSRTLGESNSIRDSCLVALQTKQTEFEKYKACNDRTIDYDKLEQQMKNDTVYKEKASNVFQKEREQYFEIQDLKAKLQDKDIAINELKKLIEKCNGKSMETKFDKPSVVRQPNAQRIPKPSVLGKPAPFLDSLERKHFSKRKSVPKTNVSEGLSKTVTTQNLPQTARQVVRNNNVIKPGMYRIDSGNIKTRSTSVTLDL
ncbi:hypothetical protein Tco_0474898 [Tanacetum coccineum]